MNVDLVHTMELVEKKGSVENTKRTLLLTKKETN